MGSSVRTILVLLLPLAAGAVASPVDLSLRARQAFSGTEAGPSSDKQFDNFVPFSSEITAAASNFDVPTVPVASHQPSPTSDTPVDINGPETPSADSGTRLLSAPDGPTLTDFDKATVLVPSQSHLNDPQTVVPTSVFRSSQSSMDAPDVVQSKPSPTSRLQALTEQVESVPSFGDSSATSSLSVVGMSVGEVVSSLNISPDATAAALTTLAPSTVATASFDLAGVTSNANAGSTPVGSAVSGSVDLSLVSDIGPSLPSTVGGALASSTTAQTTLPISLPTSLPTITASPALASSPTAGGTMSGDSIQSLLSSPTLSPSDAGSSLHFPSASSVVGGVTGGNSLSTSFRSPSGIVTTPPITTPDSPPTSSTSASFEDPNSVAKSIGKSAADSIQSKVQSFTLPPLPANASILGGLIPHSTGVTSLPSVLLPTVTTAFPSETMSQPQRPSFSSFVFLNTTRRASVTPLASMITQVSTIPTGSANSGNSTSSGGSSTKDLTSSLTTATSLVVPDLASYITICLPTGSTEIVEEIPLTMFFNASRTGTTGQTPLPTVTVTAIDLVPVQTTLITVVSGAVANGTMDVRHKRSFHLGPGVVPISAGSSFSTAQAGQGIPAPKNQHSDVAPIVSMSSSTLTHTVINNDSSGIPALTALRATPTGSKAVTCTQPEINGLPLYSTANHTLYVGTPMNGKGGKLYAMTVPDYISSISAVIREGGFMPNGIGPGFPGPAGPLPLGPLPPWLYPFLGGLIPVSELFP